MFQQIICSSGYAAFYADCEHEIKPVTSGYRVSLVYNLIQQGPGKKIAPTSIGSHAAALAELLKEHWYHYGAVMIWSPETNARLLLHQNTRSKLAWIGYLSQG